MPSNESSPTGQFKAEEIAAYMGMSVEDFLHMAGHADLVPFEQDGEYFYRQADVERFLVNAGVLEGEDAW